MQIELDNETKAAVIQQAKKQLLDALIAQFNVPQIAAEIRNAAVKDVAAMIASNIKSDKRIDEAVHRAIQSAEGRMHGRIKKAMEGGIKISFPSLD
jgi:hypothetical protein